MKIEEVIAKLRKSENKIFIDRKTRARIYLNKYGDAELCENGIRHNVNIMKNILEADFEEVEQEVPWQEALRAWAEEGKTIKCVHGDRKEVTIYYWHQNFLRDIDGTSLYKDEIRNGKWYIED